MEYYKVRIVDRRTGKYVDGQPLSKIRSAIFDNDLDVFYEGKRYMGSFGYEQLISDMKIKKSSKSSNMKKTSRRRKSTKKKSTKKILSLRDYKKLSPAGKKRIKSLAKRKR